MINLDFERHREIEANNIIFNLRCVQAYIQGYLENLDNLKVPFTAKEILDSINNHIDFMVKLNIITKIEAEK